MRDKTLPAALPRNTIRMQVFRDGELREERVTTNHVTLSAIHAMYSEGVVNWFSTADEDSVFQALALGSGQDPIAFDAIALGNRVTEVGFTSKEVSEQGIDGDTYLVGVVRQYYPVGSIVEEISEVGLFSNAIDPENPILTAATLLTNDEGLVDPVVVEGSDELVIEYGVAVKKWPDPYTVETGTSYVTDDEVDYELRYRAAPRIVSVSGGERIQSLLIAPTGTDNSNDRDLTFNANTDVAPSNFQREYTLTHDDTNKKTHVDIYLTVLASAGAVTYSSFRYGGVPDHPTHPFEITFGSGIPKTSEDKFIISQRFTIDWSGV